MNKNKSKHTPGPWRVIKPWENRNEHIQIMATANINRLGNDGPLNKGDDILIAKMFWDQTWENAHLIAAAPDLLEACEKLVAMIERGELVRNIDRDGDTDWAMRMMDFVPRLQKAVFAIAKAKGDKS